MPALYSILAVMDLGRLFQSPEHSSGLAGGIMRQGKTEALYSATVLEVSSYSQPQSSPSASSFHFYSCLCLSHLQGCFPAGTVCASSLPALCKTSLFLSPTLALCD